MLFLEAQGSVLLISYDM